MSRASSPFFSPRMKAEAHSSWTSFPRSQTPAPSLALGLQIQVHFPSHPPPLHTSTQAAGSSPHTVVDKSIKFVHNRHSKNIFVGGTTVSHVAHFTGKETEVQRHPVIGPQPFNKLLSSTAGMFPVMYEFRAAVLATNCITEHKIQCELSIHRKREGFNSTP